MIKKYEVDKHGLYFLSKSDIEFEIEEQLKGYNPELLKTPKVTQNIKQEGKSNDKGFKDSFKKIS